MPGTLDDTSSGGCAYHARQVPVQGNRFGLTALDLEGVAAERARRTADMRTKDVPETGTASVVAETGTASIRP